MNRFDDPRDEPRSRAMQYEQEKDIVKDQKRKYMVKRDHIELFLIVYFRTNWA